MKIALVDSNDNIVGYEDKLLVHQSGLLHRAFSIIIINKNNDILIQRRAIDKYHSGGLWTNSCCSHLPINYMMEDIIHIRLIEELGFDCVLEYIDKFTYYAKFENGLIEHETDYLYFGMYNTVSHLLVNPNPNEVMDYIWITYEKLQKWIINEPENFTIWFHQIFKLFLTDNEKFKKIISIFKEV